MEREAMMSVMKESCTPTVMMPMIKQVEYYLTHLFHTIRWK